MQHHICVLSEARLVDIKLHIWDDGEAPTITDWEGDFRWERISNVLEEKLATKEYGAIIRSYPATETEAAEDIGLYYRAFTDPHRGRIIVGGASPADTNAHYNRRRVECTQKVFTPAELYTLKPIRTEFDSYRVVRNFIDGFDYYGFDSNAADAEKRLEVRDLAYENEWMLGTAWFDGKPVMVIGCAGKDCEDKWRWITNGEVYAAMVTWLQTFLERNEVTGFIKASDLLPGLTEFGGRTLHDFYDVDLQEAKKI